MRAAGTGTSDFTAPGNVHLLDWACKSQRHVTRSTFAAELFGAGDSIDHGLLLSQLLKEVECGEISATQARNMREDGGFLPIALYLDAMSVFAAVTATFLKIPAEKVCFLMSSLSETC